MYKHYKRKYFYFIIFNKYMYTKVLYKNRFLIWPILNKNTLLNALHKYQLNSHLYLHGCIVPQPSTAMPVHSLPRYSSSTWPSYSGTISWFVPGSIEGRLQELLFRRPSGNDYPGRLFVVCATGHPWRRFSNVSAHDLSLWA